MTRKKKCNSESNTFVAAAEQVCLQPVLQIDRRTDRRIQHRFKRLLHSVKVPVPCSHT